MGKGDIKTRRGKLFAGTFGVRRPKKKKNKSIIGHHRISDISAPKPKPEKPEMIVREVGEPVGIQKTEVPAAPTEEQVITVSIPA
ncbi:MAG TPA: 30S ribosomal protein THX, partial [Bacteroidales bacterium]|nr:30S ribosomal protein THX [Bacteroidales bacterium]